MSEKVEDRELKELVKIYKGLSAQERFIWKRDADTLLLSKKFREQHEKTLHYKGSIMQ